VNFGPPQLTFVNFRYDTAKKNWRVQSNISRCTGPIFAIFSPYESTLGADDRFGPRFPICQGTLPWQPNNVGRSNEGGLILLHSLH